jgi:hypothetical protein
MVLTFPNSFREENEMRVFKIPAKELRLGDYLKGENSFVHVTNIEGTIVSLAKGLAFDLKGKKTVEILDVLSYRQTMPAKVKWRTKTVRAASAA